MKNHNSGVWPASAQNQSLAASCCRTRSPTAGDSGSSKRRPLQRLGEHGHLAAVEPLAQPRPHERHGHHHEHPVAAEEPWNSQGMVKRTCSPSSTRITSAA